MLQMLAGQATFMLSCGRVAADLGVLQHGVGVLAHGGGFAGGVLIGLDPADVFAPPEAPLLEAEPPSIPVLRTLLRQSTLSPKRAQQATITKRTLTADTFTMQGQNTVLIESLRASAEKRSSFWGVLLDEKEEKSERVGAGEIWKVHEVAVEYETRGARKEEV